MSNYINSTKRPLEVHLYRFVMELPTRIYFTNFNLTLKLQINIAFVFKQYLTATASTTKTKKQFQQKNKRKIFCFFSQTFSLNENVNICQRKTITIY